MTEKTPREQLAETEKQLADLAAKVDALKKQTREEDLATAKQLIKTHGFTTTDLRPELKTTRNTNATAKKSTGKGRSRKS